MPGRAPLVAAVRLSDVADVLPGLSTGMRLEHDHAGTHQIVQSRHLVPGLPYSYHPGDEFRIEPPRDASKYHVHSGDVLFMSRGTRNVATWIESTPDPSVAPVSFYILRPIAAIEPGYLTWFLNQPAAQRAIADIRTGAGTPLVQREPFSQLLVPVPDIETQRTVAQVGAAMVRERLTLERLSTITARLHDLTSEQLARELFARAETHDDK